MPPRVSTDMTGITLVGTGAVFIYAGIKGYSILAVLNNLITGKPIGTNVTVTASLAVDSSTSTPDFAQKGPYGIAGNEALGQQLAAKYGWNGGNEWSALLSLWSQESNWDNHADNPDSHAYGIPQALPYTKMPKAAWPESAGGTSDATAQINWGLDYIKRTYGTPSMAWAHEQNYNWY